MNIKAIKTREFTPPKDSLDELLKYFISHIKDGDVVVLSSKVAAICQGDCVRETDMLKDTLMRQESDVILGAKNAQILLTKKSDMLVEYGGVDYLRSAGYFVTLPSQPYKLSKQIWQKLRKQTGIKRLGVVITDSHSVPFRKGAIGMAVAGYGFKPVDIHQKIVVNPDGTSRVVRSMSDLLDGVAAAANVVMGEATEQTPLAVIRNVPEIEFFTSSYPASVMRTEMKVDPKDEVYSMLS